MFIYQKEIFWLNSVFYFITTLYNVRFIISSDGRVSENTKGLIKQLLVKDPKERLTAGQVLDTLRGIITQWFGIFYTNAYAFMSLT